MPPEVGQNGVSVASIIALLLLGAGWAWTGSLSNVTVQLFIVTGVAGLGGYSIKRQNVLAERRKEQQE